MTKSPQTFPQQTEQSTLVNPLTGLSLLERVLHEFSNPRLWGICFLLLLPVQLLFSWAEAVLAQLIQLQIGDSQQGSSPWIWLVVIFSIFISMLPGLIHAVAVLWVADLATGKQSSAGLIKERFPLLIIEQLRAMGSVLMWTLLFILPGIWRFLQLLLVPLVVLFDPLYEQGAKDALAESRIRFRHHKLKVIGFAFCSTILGPLVFTLWDDASALDGWYWSSPVKNFFFCCIELAVSLLFLNWVVRIWKKTTSAEPLAPRTFSSQSIL